MIGNNHVNMPLNGPGRMEGSATMHEAKPDHVPESTTTKAEVFSDRWIYRMTVGVLGAVMLIGCIGAIILEFKGHKIPDILLSLGSGAVGALAGLIAPSLTGHN